MTRILVFALLTTALAGGGFYLSRLVNKPDIDAAYAMPLTPPAAPMRVFHLGHSLVGRDMPAMLAQLAGNGHSYHSQLGWGTSLREHWDPKLPINGFETENAHVHYRDAKEALASGDEVETAHELGDVLFVLVRVAQKLGIEPEDALRYTNAKFERRFSHVLERCQQEGIAPQEAGLERLDGFWNEAKAAEQAGAAAPGSTT